MNDELTICKREMEQLRAHLEETRKELERRYADLEAIYRVVKVIHESLDMKRLGATVKEVVENLLGLSRYSLIIFDSVRGAYLFQVENGFGPGVMDEALLAMEKLHPGWMKRASEIGNANVLEADALPDKMTLVCLPVYGQQMMIGTLCAATEAVDSMTAESQQILSCIIGQIAIGLQNNRLYELTKSLSITDEQTNLYNLRHFQRRLSVELERAKRYRRPISLLILDIDDFSKFNTAQGISQGDMVLFDMGTILRSHCREVDIIARYGAEQFSVALPETNEAGARIVAEKLRQAVAVHPFMGGTGERGETLTVSIGICCYPQHIDDTREIIRRAEDALSRAKAEGKNRAVMAAAEVAS